MVQIIQPSDFFNPHQQQGGNLDIQRPPVQHLCPCGVRNILVFPDAEGIVIWACHRCRREHRMDFKKWDGVIGSRGNYALQRKPLHHGCDCGRLDIIVLPAGRGDIRWQCEGCQDVWGIRFDHQGGKIYKVIQRARSTDTIDS